MADAEGVALRALALVTGSEEGLGLLRDALRAHERGEGRLERMRTRLELGAALRRWGERAESREVLGSLSRAIENELSPHQREVLVAIALNGVPIDVLAERLNTTRGALYKTVHDARKKLRAHLSDQGLRCTDEGETTEARWR